MICVIRLLNSTDLTSKHWEELQAPGNSSSRIVVASLPCEGRAGEPVGSACTGASGKSGLEPQLHKWWASPSLTLSPHDFFHRAAVRLGEIVLQSP